MKNKYYASYIALTGKSISTNPKYFWIFVKKHHKSNAVPSSLYYNNQILLTGDSICDGFSDYFRSSFSILVNHSLPHLHTICSSLCNSDTRCSSINISSKTITLEEMFNLLKKIISHLNYLSYVALPLSIIFNKSFSTCIVPKFWKSAFITPVYKKGIKTDITNFRPISKLCIISKIF